jgi:hypothetical protein
MMPWWLNALLHPQATYNLYRAVRDLRQAEEQPEPTGLIPGRPGQEINSSPGTLIPPLRPDNPRRVDQDADARARDPRLVRPWRPPTTRGQ